MAISNSPFTRKYYDYPDGQDFAGKMVYMNKWAALYGLGWGATDVIMVSHTTGYLPIIARLSKFVGPFIGVASAYTFGTFVTARVRGKDDLFNNFVGSAMAGAVVGSVTKNKIVGFNMILAFTVAAYLKKLSFEEGWEFFPDNIQGWGNFRSMKHDWTLVKEGERGWTR